MKKSGINDNAQIKKINHFSSSFFQNPGYKNNNTALHQLVLECCNTAFDPDIDNDADKAVDLISKFVEEVGIDAASSMALVTNDHGMTPLRILFYIKKISYKPFLSTEKYDALNRVLLELANHKKYTSLSELISLQAVFENASQNKPLSDTLKRNLVIGTYLANKTRSTLTDSSSHPQFNTYTLEQQKSVKDAITNLRNERSCNIFQNIMFDYELIKKYKLGNCSEYSTFALAKLQSIDVKIRAERVVIKNGDHVFLVLDRNQDSDLLNPATWGDNAVICDPWAGEIYPAEDLLHKFANLTYLVSNNGKQINMITSFNMRFHKLARSHQLPLRQMTEDFSAALLQACSEGGRFYNLAAARDAIECKNIPPSGCPQ